MTQQIINVGAAPNDGTGDPLRIAFTNCNANFTELYAGVAKGVSIGSAIEYQFNNTTTEPPASGQIRFNQATQASTTKLWASHTTSSGINIKQFLSAATTGAKLILQDENDNTNYIKFDVTGTPVDKTTYWEFAVAVTASGGNLPNAAILAAVTAAAGGGGTSTVSAPQGRLTLQTGTPVMTTTQAAKTTIYYTPYVGDQIVLYSGTAMVPTTFTELSVATTDTTKNPAAVGASQILDWYVWSDAGTLRLSHGPAWSSDTARSAGTALVRVNGIWLNAVAITNACAIQRGTYVGSTRSNASSQLDWIFGAIAANGTAGVLNVWNAYNRVDVATMVGDTTSSWTYATSDFRNANASATMRVSYVAGLAEDAIKARYSCSFSTTYDAAIGVGLDTSTVASGSPGYAWSAGTTNVQAVSLYEALTAIGAHFVQAIEWAISSSTFRGQAASAGDVFSQNGLSFNFRM